MGERARRPGWELRAGMGVAAAFVTATLAADATADIDAMRLVGAMARAEHASAGSVRLPLADAAGRLPVLVPLPTGLDARSWGLLEVAPGWGGAQWSPAQVLAFGAAHSAPVITGPPRRTFTNRAAEWTRASEFREVTGLDGTGVVVGVIDTGLDLAHPDFRDTLGRTRVGWFMARGLPYGAQPELEDRYGCTDEAQSPCAILDADDIDGLILAGTELPADEDGHGTHVTSIAAGNGGLMPGTRSSFVGVAPNATVIIGSPSPGGGFSDPDILRAARFIFDRADEMGMPAVVNVSLGSDFGPHDGTSALERGLASMVGPDHPGHVVVVAAGNSGALYTLQDEGPFGVHTEVHAPIDGLTRVPMRAAGARGRVDGGAYVWITFDPDDEVSVGLEGPGGSTWIGLTDPGEEQGYESGEMMAGVINNLVNGKSSLTADTNGAVLFWQGAWDAGEELAVLLEGGGHARLWITGTGGAAPGPGGLGMLFSRATKQGTIAVPASAPELIAVGCTLNRTSWRPLGSSMFRLELAAFGPQSPPVIDSTCYFSASGPNALGQVKPDLVAPGALVAGAVSRGADPRTNDKSLFLSPSCPDDNPDCYLLDERHGMTSGTSMSAPQVAGAAALLLQRDPTLTQAQVLELLQAGARYPTGEVAYDYQLGAGALDLLNTLDVLESRAGGAVNAGASWFVLAAPYLRPDPQAAVHGMIEVRDADGRVILDLEPSEVEVRVQGAVVAIPPTHVRAGLFRFAIAALGGTGGTTAQVEVRVRGRSLGARMMAVSVDSWASQGGVGAAGGGCAAGGGGKPSALWLWALALAVGVAARRSRKEARV